MHILVRLLVLACVFSVIFISLGKLGGIIARMAIIKGWDLEEEAGSVNSFLEGWSLLATWVSLLLTIGVDALLFD